MKGWYWLTPTQNIWYRIVSLQKSYYIWNVNYHAKLNSDLLLHQNCLESSQIATAATFQFSITYRTAKKSHTYRNVTREKTQQIPQRTTNCSILNLSSIEMMKDACSYFYIVELTVNVFQWKARTIPNVTRFIREIYTIIFCWEL